MLSDYRDEDLEDRCKRLEVGRKRIVVTGAAGFIGSHLVDELLAAGCEVVGVDNFDPWYAPELKRANLASAHRSPKFSLSVADLATSDLTELFANADVVFHLAARPGVQDSWGSGFAEVCQLNVGLTQRVFDAALASAVPRVVYASSSSVYGDGVDGDRRAIAPISPYGVSKAAGEQLAGVYARRGLDVVSLRFFTVFGPRQRPDMAMHRLFVAAGNERTRQPFFRRGDGEQQREFTFVGDVVDATARIGLSDDSGLSGRTFDVGGGCAASLNEVISEVGRVVGRVPLVLDQPASPGDPRLTVADLKPIGQALGWAPSTGLGSGLERQWAWHRRDAVAATMLRFQTRCESRSRRGSAAVLLDQVESPVDASSASAA